MFEIPLVRSASNIIVSVSEFSGLGKHSKTFSFDGEINQNLIELLQLFVSLVEHSSESRVPVSPQRAVSSFLRRELSDPIVEAIVRQLSIFAPPVLESETMDLTELKILYVNRRGEAGWLVGKKPTESLLEEIERLYL